MLTLLYSFGSVISLHFAAQIFRYRNISYLSKLILLSVTIIPLGKLIYLPVPGMMGLKFQFLFASLIGLISIVSSGINKKMLVVLLPISIALISILFLQDFSHLFFYQYIELAGYDAGNYTGGRESVLFRFLSLVTLLLYMMAIFNFILINSNNAYLLARYYIYGLIAASLVGLFIFIQVWIGNISVLDLAPISADSHIIGNFYRFNPGANVNEFSMLIAFGILLLPFCKFTNLQFLLLLTFFILCEFAGLTRSSWISLFLALVIGALFKENFFKTFIFIFISFFSVFIVFTFLYLYIPEVEMLINTRLALDIGISGFERLDKFQFVFEEIKKSSLPFIFGHGWATNLYVHNVYFQLLYEVGLLGLLIFTSFFILIIKDIFLIKPSIEKSCLVGIIIFIASSAFFQHTLYHVQTWLMLGFVSGMSYKILMLTK
jgi:hypothetical protein